MSTTKYIGVLLLVTLLSTMVLSVGNINENILGKTISKKIIRESISENLPIGSTIPIETTKETTSETISMNKIINNQSSSNQVNYTVSLVFIDKESKELINSKIINLEHTYCKGNKTCSAGSIQLNANPFVAMEKAGTHTYKISAKGYAEEKIKFELNKGEIHSEIVYLTKKSNTGDIIISVINEQGSLINPELITFSEMHCIKTPQGGSCGVSSPMPAKSNPIKLIREPGEYTYTFYVNGFENASVSVLVEAGITNVEKVVMKKILENGVINIKVADENGNLFSPEQLRYSYNFCEEDSNVISTCTSTTLMWTKTNPLVINGPTGNYNIFVLVDGFEQGQLNVSLKTGEIINEALKLKPKTI